MVTYTIRDLTIAIMTSKKTNSSFKFTTSRSSKSKAILNYAYNHQMILLLKERGLMLSLNSNITSKINALLYMMKSRASK